MPLLTRETRLKKSAPLIAGRLRKLRAAAGYSQQELATRAGLSIRAVTQIEQGTTPDPRVSTVVALVGALGVDFEALVGEPTRTVHKKRGRPR
jgi:transcriptional regulator with XRE-family HTH domain